MVMKLMGIGSEGRERDGKPKRSVRPSEESIIPLPAAPLHTADHGLRRQCYIEKLCGQELDGHTA